MTDGSSGLGQGLGSGGSPPRLAVGEYLDQWLEGRVNPAAGQFLFYRVAVDRYLKPELGNLRLSDLRATASIAPSRGSAAASTAEASPCRQR